MAHTSGRKKKGRFQSSIVARLNIKLFFRLLGIYLMLDLLLVVLFCGGLVAWSEGQAARLAALAEERGVPSTEATEWMTAGSYTVTAEAEPPEGIRLPTGSPARRSWRERSGISAPARWICSPSSPSPPAAPPAIPW